MTHRLVVGTRGSALAAAQTRMVVDALNRILAEDTDSDATLEIATIPTTGDNTHDKVGANANDQTSDGSPTDGSHSCAEELRDALREKRVDVIVQRADQLPVKKGAGVRIACTPWRASTHDTLCTATGWTLDTLPEGAVVGSASPCRSAQLAAYRKDLKIVPVRGSIESQLGSLNQELEGSGYQGMIMPEASLDWMSSVNNSVLDYVTQVIPYCIMLPNPGQGVLALEVRDPSGDDDDNPQYRALLRALEQLNDPGTFLALTAERALVAALEADCQTPVAGFAWHQPSSAGRLLMRSEVFTPEGTRIDTLGDIRLPAPETCMDPRCGWTITTEMCDAAKSLGSALADDLFSQGYKVPR